MAGKSIFQPILSGDPYVLLILPRGRWRKMSAFGENRGKMERGNGLFLIKNI